MDIPMSCSLHSSDCSIETWGTNISWLSARMSSNEELTSLGSEPAEVSLVRPSSHHTLGLRAAKEYDGNAHLVRLRLLPQQHAFLSPPRTKHSSHRVSLRALHAIPLISPTVHTHVFQFSSPLAPQLGRAGWQARQHKQHASRRRRRRRRL
jgi:hypothetical protein